jgi:predicted AlkP superfamily pyrophosphatase or phosphodiesterase
VTPSPRPRRARCGALLLVSLLACNRIEEHRLPPLPEPATQVDRRLLVFGIDGATWTVIDRLFGEGRLPNLARLVREGSRAPLRTLVPTHSPRIWTTLATGVLPEVHGILDFVVRIPGTDRTTLPSSAQRRVAALWNVLSDHGYRVGVANWWASYPAEPIDGFVISDRASPVRRASYRSTLRISDEGVAGRHDGETHPPELAKALDSLLDPPGEPDPALLARLAPLSPELLARLREQRVYSREEHLSVLKFTLLQDLEITEASLYALRRYSPDVMLHFFAGVDAIEHHFWKFMEPDAFEGVPADEVAIFGNLIGRYYELADEVLGRFLAAYGDAPLTVVVVSDHGHEADPRHGSADARGQSLWASGTHKDAPDGILIVSGADVVRGAVLDDPSVLDLTPTVLALLGVPIGADMSGRVLREAIAPAFQATHPLRSVASHTRPESASPGPAVASDADPFLEQKLRALGYLE